MTEAKQTSLERLSVALLSPGWPAVAMANGIVSYTATVRRGLQDLGVRCHVLTPRPMCDPGDETVHHVRSDSHRLLSKVMRRLSPELWPQRTFCASLLRTVAGLRSQDNLALLELEESYGWARLLASGCPVPLVVRLHGPWFLNGVANGVPQDAAFHRRDQWEKAGLIAAQAITAPSRHVLEQTRSHFGLALADAQVIPNPVEQPADADRWTLEQCDQRRIVFIGRFDRHKGGDTILDAFSRVAHEYPDVRLDVVGPDRGYTDEAGRTWKIEQYLKEKMSESARQRVIYHGFQPPVRAAELRKRALVTVAPSRYETFGIAAAEAMAAGCPVAVCGGGALAEMVQHDHNGVVAQPGDSGDLAVKLLSLLRDPTRAARLGEQAARDAQQYSPRVIAEQTLDFYRRVLGRPTAAANQPSSSTARQPANVSA